MLRPICGRAGRPSCTSTPSFVLLARHRAARGQRSAISTFRWRLGGTEQTVDPAGQRRQASSLAVPSESRYSEIQVQQLSSHLYPQVFPSRTTSDPPPELVKLARDHLSRHELLGKTDDKSGPVAFDLPPLVGQTLDEHFHKLGVDASEPFLTYAKQFARANAPRNRGNGCGVAVGQSTTRMADLRR